MSGGQQKNGNTNNLRIFAGRHTKTLAGKVCDHLNIELGDAKTFEFPDGELLVKIDEDVRGRDCYVIISTCRPVNENIVELLIFVDSLRRASAHSVSVVMPYYGYGRQDRKDEGRVPITAKLIANLVTKAGADRVLALDLHAAQIQGFFDIPMDHLTAMPVFLDYFRRNRDTMGDLVVLSPDVGNVKVADRVADMLGATLAVINKRRVSGEEVITREIVGSVEGKTVLMFDDMISTAGTVCAAARVVKERGAGDIMVAATHPVLVGPAIERLESSPISKLIVTDTIPLCEQASRLGDRVLVLSVAHLLGDAIHNIHNNLSVSALFRDSVGPKR